jgi:hypothetical protein
MFPKSLPSQQQQQQLTNMRRQKANRCFCNFVFTLFVIKPFRMEEKYIVNVFSIFLFFYRLSLDCTFSLNCDFGKKSNLSTFSLSITIFSFFLFACHSHPFQITHPTMINSFLFFSFFFLILFRSPFSFNSLFVVLVLFSVCSPTHYWSHILPFVLIDVFFHFPMNSIFYPLQFRRTSV